MVPAGSYMMGSSPSEAGRYTDEGPVHRVTIAEPFAVGRYEVTFAEWDACHRAGGCSHRPNDQGWGRGNRPVVDMNWHDAQEYVDWLSGETGRSYRLLSESEWEYVARAGTTTRFWWGDEIGHNRANCSQCGSAWDGVQTAPVGSFPANPFGLYDVHGNVYEWVQDCYWNSYAWAPSDGSARPTWDCGSYGDVMRVVVRGGSGGNNWTSDPDSLRSAYRRSLFSNLRLSWGGFRVAAKTIALRPPPVPYTLPLIRPAGHGQEGFVRIINHSNASGAVRIEGIDDAGTRNGPITLSLEAHETRHFNSGDLEEGNTSKGLSDGLGNGTGDWRLELTTDLDIEPSAYIRTPDGFLTAMHAVARTADVGGEVEHHVPIFNPASNRNQVSGLRIANLADEVVEATIRALDDAGEPAWGGEVRVTLPPNGARRISSQQLEFGDSAFAGRLGPGTGKWQLFVTADGPIEVVSLLQSPTGHLSNLSTTPAGAPSSSDDHGDTIADATEVAVGSTVSGRIDSPDDVDYFRIQVAQTGILVVSTSGEAATELELVDTDGNPLPASVHPSMSPPSGTADDMGVRAVTIASNIASKEVEVQAGDIVIAKVTGKGRLGGFKLESKIVVPGVTNVLRTFPVGGSMSAGGSGYTLDVSGFFSPSQAELTYSATVQQPVSLGGVPLNLGITVSGSVMTIIAAEDGPAYSGTVAITVRVSDPRGLFAVQVLNLEFTREVTPGPNLDGCISVQRTQSRYLPGSDSLCVDVNGAEASHIWTLTNSCSYSVDVRYSFYGVFVRPPAFWSDYGDNLASGETKSKNMGCYRYSPAPRFRVCAFILGLPFSDPNSSSRCYGENPSFQYY